MNQLKENPFLTGIILITVLGCGILGFLATGAMSTYQQTMDAYTQAVSKLQGLQNRVPFPNEANIKQAEQLRDAYKARLEGLKEEFASLQTPLPENVTPQQFQDTLRTTVNEVSSMAEASGVGLPEGFFLGFDQYRDSLPSDKAAPFLARQLTIISGIIKELIGSNPENPGIRSIQTITRTPLPEEGPAMPVPSPGGPAAARNAKPEDPLTKNPFLLGFTAEQGKFRIAFNNLVRNNQFLIVRSLFLRNSNPEGPSIVQETPETSTPIAFETPGQPAATRAPGLNVILGRELVQVDLLLEIVNFRAPETSPSPAPAS